MPKLLNLKSKKIKTLTSGYISNENYVENVSIGDYIIIKELGSGSTAKVVLAFNKNSNTRVAIKIVKRKNGINVEALPEEEKSNDANIGFNDERIYREAVISTLLDHPHIIKLLDFLYSDLYFFLIFEYVKGDQLYDIIMKEKQISEEKARKYFRQIISAINYVHQNSIVHRDLKIENVVVDQNDNIKILDFGLSNFYDNKNLLKTFCGSLYFAAPELLHGQLYSGPEVDVWSLGIILYVMLCGKVPFDDDSVRELQNKIKSASFEFCSDISKKAKDLISKMIVNDISKRFTMSEVIKSEWINIGYSSTVESYIGIRYPLAKLNNEYLKAIHTVLQFQFQNSKEHLENFFNTCKNMNESIDKIYGIRNPIISMYYLLSENISAYSNSDINFITFDCESNITEEIIHKFISFVFSNNNTQRPTKYFYTGAFRENNSEEQDLNKKINLNLPAIQKCYFKGLFQGIKVKHIGSHNAFKKILMDIFIKNSIIFEADECGYYCTFYDENEECYFKVVLYFNVIFSQYYLVMKCLNSKSSSFRNISKVIENSLKYRN